MLHQVGTYIKLHEMFNIKNKITENQSVDRDRVFGMSDR